MSFELLKTDGLARRGRLTLHHGVVETPVFMPVGTYGAVKTQSPAELKGLGTQILLSNTYHLYLRPGLSTLRKFGGLHRWMGWDRPILTDSGGFQIFSLARTKKMDDHAVVFQSHLDGSLITLSPEIAAEIQQAIGSDIAMVLDECVGLPNSPEIIQNAVDRSLRWAKRFLDVPRLPTQKIFGINQGGLSRELRSYSLEKTLELPIDGVSIGGLSVGESHAEMMGVLDDLAPKLPPQLPHYLMGVGTPRDILEAVARGIDMFDCVLPTRNARNGGLFTPNGLLNIRNSIHREAEEPVDADCGCETCQTFSRSYLRHLFQTQEILGLRLATTHNLYYYQRFLSEIRDAIDLGQFQSFYQEWSPRLAKAYGAKTSSE